MNWLNSTNAKEIGTLYLIFAVFAGMIGTAFSVLIRLELSSPGVQFLQGDHQLFNVIISAHAFIMIFFMVMPGLVGGFGNIQISLFINSLNNLFYLQRIINKITASCSSLILLIVINKVYQGKIITLISSFNLSRLGLFYKFYNSIRFISGLSLNLASSAEMPFYKNNSDSTANINILRTQIGPYLAGLIEGDGTIAVSKSNNKYNPKIIVVFKKADLPLAKFLQNLTQCGQVLIKPERGYNLWQIQDIVSIFTIINIINGYMRTPKIEALNRAITWVNDYIDNTNSTNKYKLLSSTKFILSKINKLEIKPLDESPIESNSWLTGFTDADGNFSINIHKRTNKNSTRVQLYYRLEVNQNYHKADLDSLKVSFFPIMSKIGLFLGVTVYSRSRLIKDKIYHSFTVMSNNKESNYKVCNYFDNYPLLSSKYLDYKDWAYILELQNLNKLTASYLDIAIKTRTNFNKTRKTFSWDHLPKKHND